MIIENKPSDTDAGDSELKSSEKEEDVSKTKDLETKSPEEVTVEYYKELTGREDIKTKEDFDKHYEGLKKLVGDQEVAEMRKKAEKYDEIQEEAKKEADKFLETDEGKKLAKEQEGEVLKKEVSELGERFKEMDFLKKNPEVEPFIDLIKAVAVKEGISYEKAYKENPIGDLITSKLEVEKKEKEEKNISIESKSRIAPGVSQEISQLVEQIGKTDSTEAKQKLVEKVLGLSEEK